MKPQFVVYTVIETPGNGPNFWQRVGSAWSNKDGSLNIKLNALPVNGSLHVRAPTAKEEQEQAPQAEQAAPAGEAF